MNYMVHHQELHLEGIAERSVPNPELGLILVV